MNKKSNPSSSVQAAHDHLEERLAALHEASLELVQDISCDSLLRRIGQIACEQTGAAQAIIGIRGEDEQVERFIAVGSDDVSENILPPIGSRLITAIEDAEKPVRVMQIGSDMHLDSFSQDAAASSPNDPNSPQPTAQVNALLCVPLRLGQRRFGQIYLSGKPDGDPFTPDDERVIETLSAYAAVAISNARSYEALRERDRTLTRRNQDLALINNLASVLASITELDELIKIALNRVINYFDVAIGEIYLNEDDPHTLSKVLHQGPLDTPLWTQTRFSTKGGLIPRTARSSHPSIVSLPYRHDPHLKNQDLMDAGIKQIACFPLTSRSEVLGVLSIALSREEPLDAMDQQLLSSIASWVGTTIENIRLNIQGRRLAVLEERERIGMDLHDGIIQSIYAVGLTLEHARLLLSAEPDQTRTRIDQSIEDLNSTIRDLRAFIMDMRPRHLYEENLLDGLQRLLKEFQANSLVEATLSGPPSESLNECFSSDLPDPQAIALFHICQEALANVAKHARAKKVEVLVWTTPERVLMEVHDDGRGFDLKKVHLTLGHGISNMQTRARNAGGDLEITTEPGEGTTIMVWVPCTQETQEAVPNWRVDAGVDHAAA